MSQIT